MKKIFVTIFIFLLAFSGRTQLNNEWIDYNKTYYKFLIGEDGICRISKATLDSWGIGNTSAQHFQLWRNGVEVPIFTSEVTGSLASNGFIEFIGRKNDGIPDRAIYLQATFQLSNRLSLFTDTAAYFLTVNSTSANRRFNDIPNDLTGNLPTPLPYLLHTVRHDYKRPSGIPYVNKGFAVNYGEYVYSSSYDQGEMLSSEDISPGTAQANRTAVFNNLLPAQIPGINARFRVSWASSASVPGVSSRDITASIGNTNLATRRLNNFQAFRDSNISVSTSLLEGATTTIAITNLSSNQFDRVVVGFCEIEYPRQTNAGGASFFESSLPAGNGDALLELSNFNHGGVAPVLYNLTTGTRMTGNLDGNGNVRFRIAQTGQRQNFIITSYNGSFFRNINQGTAKTFINYAQANQSGDYLIITNKRLMNGNAVENYRAYRAGAAGGAFNAKIYDIEELVDQFAFGIKMHPLGIKNFLRFARQNFPVPPKFCFLIGKGVTYDEMRVNESSPLATQLQLVPTFGYPGSDNLLASNDLSALPATPIGRLSAVNTGEITAYLEKVKEFEAAQANPSVSQLDKAWMKNVVHVVGANDAGTELQIRPFMNEYERVVKDTLFGGNVTTFNKFNSTTASTIENIVLSNLFQSGISLLTYFGHSSATALDYNLDDPNQYNNPGKYPVFMLNGCNAGNFFTFERQRLDVQSTISEKYVLAPNRGAIGLVASTHFGLVSGLGVYTRGFYRSLSNQAYAETLGKHIQNSVQFMYNTWGTDYQARFHTEQQTLHGDPAIKINSHPKPDYSIESPNIIVEPSFLSIAETKFDSKIYFYNLGKAINDSITVEVKRQYPQSSIYPNGFTETVYRQKRKAPLFLDSLQLSFPINSERDKGINLLTVTLDADNRIDEISELNNTIARQVVIFENELRPVYPANFAIVNNQNTKLIASTANPLSEALNYAFEIDTTDRFNSPAKITRTINARGGIVEIDPGISFVNNRVYYWRLGLQPQVGGSPLRWNHASFVYLSGTETGFNQSHFYQHTKSSANRMRIDSTSRTWRFNESLNNLFVTHSIFPTSGNEDSHFALSVNNNLVSISACVGHSLIFNVFDALTFKPIMVNGPWTSGYCTPNRNPFNYEWDDRNTGNRKQMMDFMDSIPAGSFVVVRKLLDTPYESETFADIMKSDENIHGAGNSLYHKLKNAGFSSIDSFNRPRTFIFVYKKNDPSFTDVRMSDGLFDRIQLNLNIPTIDTLGIVSSPVLGPAKSWKNAQWNGSAEDGGNGDRVRIRVIGVSPNGAETGLFSVSNTVSNIDLSSVNAQQYPQLKLVMENIDSVKGTPWNLDYWRVYYTPVPEGALAANMLLQNQDSLAQGQPYDFRIAFKNISPFAFDSVKVRMSVTNSSNVTTTTDIRRRPLAAGDTLIISLPLDTRQYPGLNTIYIAANPDNDQPEQFFFNNFLYSSFFVKEDLTDPLLDVTFDGVHILNRDIVSSRPHIQIKLKDENTFALLNDTAGVTIRLQYPGENTPRVYRWNTDTLRFVPPSSGNNNTASIDFFPALSIDSENSEYELLVSGRDRNNNPAGAKDYRVSFRVFNKPMISNLLNYPNPFSTSTAFVFTITGAEVPQEFKIQILTVTGKIVKEITKAELGPIRVGTNITDYKWDGTDMFGQKLANGVYLYRVVTSLDGNKMEQFKLNEGYNQNTMDVTDQFFKRGYGKMVILR
jgi:hypothetical protein